MLAGRDQITPGQHDIRTERLPAGRFLISYRECTG